MRRDPQPESLEEECLCLGYDCQGEGTKPARGYEATGNSHVMKIVEKRKKRTPDAPPDPP